MFGASPLGGGGETTRLHSQALVSPTGLSPHSMWVPLMELAPHQLPPLSCRGISGQQPSSGTLPFPCVGPSPD